MKKFNRITYYLIISLIVVFIACIGTFISLTFYMKNKSEKTIDQVGNVYMEGINERVSKHFSTMVDLRLKQLETLVEIIPSDKTDTPEIRQQLIHSAKINDFEALAYYFEDGSSESLFGDSFQSLDAEEFLRSMQKGERKVSIALNVDNSRAAMIGVPLRLKMQDGKESIAIIAKMSIEYISNTLSLDEEDALFYSFIVRKDGNFVVHSADAYRDNYFDRVREVYEEVRGMDRETYIKEIRQAMEEKRDYSAMFKMKGGWRQLYCSSLPASEWCLITILPYGTLNEAIEQQNSDALYVFMGSCSLLLLLLVGIFIGYFRMNHSQIKELEAAKYAAEKANKSKSEFLSNMSHDIRTPMNAIVGMTAIALNNLDNPEKVKNALKKVELSSKHLLGLINDVLDMSKIESGKMILNVELVSLKEIMDSIVSIVQPQIKSKQQKFNIYIYDILSEKVLCDSVRLNQILINLLSNAIKFTPEGGSIEVSLHEVASPKGDDYVRILIHVKDTGIGMSEEFMEHIFDSFTREDSHRVQKTEGTGLGMAITKYIVDTMGGTIDVTSKQGVGTEFKVALDFERVENQEKMILPDFTMLVVDDDQQLCESTTESLKSIGIKAEWTQDGKTAVEMIKRHHAIHNEYQIILLDWKMPGMDGICIAKEIRKELGNEVPILLISAYDCSEIEEEAKAAGINGFLSKPLFKSTLYYGLKPYINITDELPVIEQTDEVNLAGKRILLAEDNELNKEIASELLKGQGLLVEWAENGQVCYDMFIDSKEYYYDAILMDIRMPIKNGYEATEMIRNSNRKDSSIPIVAMTADAFSEDIKKCLQCGMNAHIAKPINIKEILKVLNQFIIKD